MALMNRVGSIFYNLGLVMALSIIFLCFKNYSFDPPSATAEYSSMVRLFIYIAVGSFLFLNGLLLLLVSLSKARKKNFIYWTLFVLQVMLLSGMAIITFARGIFDEPIDSPEWGYFLIPILTIISFATLVALILMQMPGSVEHEKLIAAIKKELKKDVEEALPFCPKCNYRVKPDWKHCPSCGSKFSD